MKYYQTLKISLLRPTNTKGLRVKIESLNNKKAVILPYDYYYNLSKDIAINFLNSKGIEIFGISATEEYYLILIDCNANI